MRFRVSVDVWVEAESLADAQAAMGRVESAAHDALGQAATPDPDTGARWRGEMIPVDTAAADALAADGLGPGISSRG